MKWRWAEGLAGHLEVQCEHMAALDPDDWATLPLHPEIGWTIVHEEPLTVIPSIFNTVCGCHGYIDQGVWVPAE